MEFLRDSAIVIASTPYGIKSLIRFRFKTKWDKEKPIKEENAMKVKSVESRTLQLITKIRIKMHQAVEVVNIMNTKLQQMVLKLL